MAVGSKSMRTRAMHAISSAKAPPRECPPASHSNRERHYVQDAGVACDKVLDIAAVLQAGAKGRRAALDAHKKFQ